MEKNDYLDILKNTNLRPNKIQIKEKKEEVLLENDNSNMNNIHNKIIEWFMNNPYPNDEKVHNFAQEMGMDPDKFEGHIYMILSSILSEGKSKNFKGTFNSEEIKKGIKVEMEHTTIPLLAEKIAKDHLAEIPDYYTRLDKMEKEAGINENTLLTEIFVQAGEIQNMPPGNERDIQIIRLSMIAELDASNLYEKMAGLTSNKKLKKLLLDISHEEKVHGGEFGEALVELDPAWEDAEKEGEDEAKDILK